MVHVSTLKIVKLVLGSIQVNSTKDLLQSSVPKQHPVMGHGAAVSICTRVSWAGTHQPLLRRTRARFKKQLRFSVPYIASTPSGQTGAQPLVRGFPADPSQSQWWVVSVIQPLSCSPALPFWHTDTFYWNARRRGRWRKEWWGFSLSQNEASMSSDGRHK